ncbi:MAG: peptidylprolyl isomerase [Pseudomonadota bacterium]
MFKKIISLSAIILISTFCFAKEENSPADKIVAKVDGRDIYESEVKAKVTAYATLNAIGDENGFNYDTLTKEMKDEIIKNMILGDLILKQAKQAKITDTTEYKQALQFSENQLMQKLFLDQLIRNNVTEAKLQEKYKQMAAEQSEKDEYKVRHILVKTEKEALDIEKKLKKGEDFTALAKQYSIDGTKEDGGNLDYFSSGQMVLAFEEATAKLKIGQISAPVKTDFGYHIIKLEGKRKMKPENFEQLRPKLFEAMAGQFMQEYISQLKAENKVEIF